MSVLGLGCVKTCTGKECAELFSLLASPDSGRQRYWFSNRQNRDGISTRKFCVGVFTQPGSKTVLTALKRHFRSTPNNGHQQTGPVGPFRANNGSGESRAKQKAARRRLLKFKSDDRRSDSHQCWL